MAYLVVHANWPRLTIDFEADASSRESRQNLQQIFLLYLAVLDQVFQLEGPYGLLKNVLHDLVEFKVG